MDAIDGMERKQLIWYGYVQRLGYEKLSKKVIKCIKTTCIEVEEGWINTNII